MTEKLSAPDLVGRIMDDCGVHDECARALLLEFVAPRCPSPYLRIEKIKKGVGTLGRARKAAKDISRCLSIIDAATRELMEIQSHDKIVDFIVRRAIVEAFDASLPIAQAPALDLLFPLISAESSRAAHSICRAVVDFDGNARGKSNIVEFVYLGTLVAIIEAKGGRAARAAIGMHPTDFERTAQLALDMAGVQVGAGDSEQNEQSDGAVPAFFDRMRRCCSDGHFKSRMAMAKSCLDANPPGADVRTMVEICKALMFGEFSADC